MATYYWVNGSGTWDSTSADNWATTSGGSSRGSVKIPSGGNLNVPVAIQSATTTTPFTLELWIYPTITPSATGFVGSQYPSGTIPFAMMTGALGGVSGSNLSFGYYNGSSWIGISSSTPLVANQWSHIAGVYDGTTATLYLNGTSIGTYTGAWTNVAGNSPFYIGRRHDGFGTAFAGHISNFRLVLGTAVYSGASITVPTSPLTAITGTKILLNAATPATYITDSSTNNYTLTLTGTPTWSARNPFDNNTAPTSADDVYFDSLSSATSYTVTIGTGAVCLSSIINKPASGSVTLLDNGNQIQLYGSLITDSSGIISSQTGGFTFRNQSSQIWYSINVNGNTAFSATPIRINCQPNEPAAGIILAANASFGNVTLDDGNFDLRGSTLTCTNLTVNSGSTPTPTVVTYTQGTDYAAGALLFRPNVGIVLYGNQFTNFIAVNNIGNRPSGTSYTLNGSFSALTTAASQYNAVGGYTYQSASVPIGFSPFSDTNITSISFTYTPTIGGGLSSNYGTVRTSGNFTVATQNGNRTVSFNDTGVPGWTIDYTSQITNVSIGVVDAQQYRYYIEVVFPPGGNGYNFWNQVMYQGSGTPYSVTMSGRCQNTVGSSFFTANNAGTWLDFNIPKGIFNSWQQQGGNPSAYRNEFQWFGVQSWGATFANSAGTGATMVASGGGADELRLTGATSKFSGGLLSTSSPISYPFVTFKSTAPIANTYYSNQGKEIADGSSIKNLYIEGPAATGHTLVCISGTVTISKSLTVNANTTGPLSRVLIWYDQAGQNTTYVPSSTEAKFAFPNDNSGTAVLKDTDLRNIKFTGGYVTMMSNVRVGDMGGCTNVGADSPKTWYWTNGTFGGNLLWTTTNWASTSAGTVVTDGFPLPQDTIKITDDLLTSGGTLTIQATDGILPTLDFSSRSLPVTLSTGSNNMYVSGNINIPNGPTTITATGGYIYLIGGTAQTITGAYRTWNKSIAVSAPFANVSFASNFTSSVSYSSASTPSLAVARGKLDISDKTITVKEFSAIYPYSGASRTLVTTANTQINLSGTGGVWNATGAGWTVTGPNPKLYLTDSTSGSKSIGNYYSFSSSDLSNGWTFKPVDVYALAGSGPVTVNGVFGTVDMCSGTCTGTLTLSVYSIVTDYLRVLDNSNLNAQFNLAPANGNTCQFITNWVYGQGAVGTNGSSTNLLTIGFDANRQYGTVILTGNLNVTAYAGYGIYHTPSTFDISNYTVRLNAYSVFNSPSYNTALIMNNSTITLLDPTSPASFSTTRFTPTYNSNSSINITGYTGPNLPTISASSGIVIPPIAIKNGYGITLSIANSTIASLSATGGQTINIQAGTTANFKALSINGTRNNPVVIKSTSSGTRSYIGKTGGAVIATGLSLTDITASGNAEFTAYESPSATRSSGWTVNTIKRPPSGFLSFC